MRKLILFDIDGTILTTGGAARRAFERALLEAYGTTGPIGGHEFSGKTDPQIARELLTLAGLDAAAIAGGSESLFEAYLRELEIELSAPGYRTVVFPGVHALLDALEGHASAPVVGLLTGNIDRGATLKLRSVGLEERFRFGVFGSDSEHRPDLPPLALRRAEAMIGARFEGKDVVIIGDTPHDVTCGRGIGAFAVGVATGRHGRRALREAGADLVLEDLSATDEVVAAVTG